MPAGWPKGADQWGSPPPGNKGGVRPYRQPVQPAWPNNQRIIVPPNNPGNNAGPTGHQEKPATWDMQARQMLVLSNIFHAIKGIRHDNNGIKSSGGGGGKSPSIFDNISNMAGVLGQLLGGARQFGGGLGKGHLLSALFGGARAAKGMEAYVGSGAGAGGAAGGGAGASAGGAMGALRGLGAAGPIGIAVAAIAATGVAAFEFGKELKKATEAMIDHNRKYGEVHAGMATLYALRDLREMLRDRDKAGYLLGPTSRAIATEQQFKDQIFPWQVVWEELKSGFLIEFYQTMTGVLTTVNDILKLLGAEFKHKPTSGSGFGDAVLQIQDQHYKRLGHVMPQRNV